MSSGAPPVGPKPRYSIAHAASGVTLLMFLQPVMGLVLEIGLAWRFGASGTIDAFRTANLLILFGSQLFGAYFLPHLVIPLLAESRARGEEQQGWRIALTFGQLLVALALAFAILVCLYPVPAADFLAPGMQGSAREALLILIRYFSVALTAILTCGVIAGFLNIHGVFAVTALTQPINNFAIFVFAVALGRLTPNAAIGTGVLAGLAVVLLLHVRALVRVARGSGIGLRSAFRPGCWPEVFRLAAQAIPLLIVVAGFTMSAVLQNQALSELGEGRLARFGYASKMVVIFNLPPIALATVMFPFLSEAHAFNAAERARGMTNRALQMLLLVTGPPAVALYFLSGALVHAAFGHGAMDSAALAEITSLFTLLLLQTCPGALMFFLYKICFSRGDRWAAVVSASSGRAGACAPC